MAPFAESHDNSKVPVNIGSIVKVVSNRSCHNLQVDDICEVTKETRLRDGVGSRGAYLSRLKRKSDGKISNSVYYIDLEPVSGCDYSEIFIPTDKRRLLISTRI